MTDHLNGNGAHDGAHEELDSIRSAIARFQASGRSSTQARSKRESVMAKLSTGKHAIRATGRTALFSVRCHPDVLAWLNAYAEERDLPKADLLEVMVEALKAHGDEP